MKHFFAAAFALVVAASPLAQAQDAKAAKILDQMSAKYQAMKSFKANFTQTLENQNSGIKENMDGEITVAGNKFRLNMKGQEIINNGTTVYTYLKDENEVNVSDYEPDANDITPGNIFSMYKKGYKYVYVEDAKEGGKTYEVVELTPEDRSNPFFKIRLMIDKSDKSLKSWKMFNKTNGNRYTYTIKSFTPNVPLDANAFTFDKTKYKGVKVIDLR